MEVLPSASTFTTSLSTAASSAILTPDRTSLSTATIPTPRSSSITFIDPSAPDYELLQQGLQPGTEVYVLDSTQDAIAQITRTLAGRSGISSLNIVSHGDIGSIHFASLRFDQHNLNQYTNDLQQWAQALTSDADILLYGCDIAQGDLGASFVQQLSQLTGADVAASIDPTGSTQLGGNWTLEYHTGSIEAEEMLQPWAQSAYQHLLAVFAVTNTNDQGAGSLRQAVLDANRLAGVDEIIFSLRGSDPHTITLTSGQLEITEDLFISGLGQENLTISGNSLSRVFQINRHVRATLTGLTIADGQSDLGGGILNAGRLDIRHSTLKNNKAESGGAIANGVSDEDNSAVSLTLNNVQLTNNNSVWGAGLMNLATATVRASTFSNNVAENLGGGIFTTGNLTVHSSTFHANQASSGGGIATGAFRGHTTVDNSTFSSNWAAIGGAIYNASTASVINSSFESNSAVSSGGAIYDQGATTVSYSSFKNNMAQGQGGAIYSTAAYSEGELRLEFSTLANNWAHSGGGMAKANGKLVRIQESQIYGNTALFNGANLLGGFISEGGNDIGDPAGSIGFIDGVLGDRVHVPLPASSNTISGVSNPISDVLTIEDAIVDGNLITLPDATSIMPLGHITTFTTLDSLDAIVDGNLIVLTDDAAISSLGSALPPLGSPILLEPISLIDDVAHHKQPAKDGLAQDKQPSKDGQIDDVAHHKQPAKDGLAHDKQPSKDGQIDDVAHHKQPAKDGLAHDKQPSKDEQIDDVAHHKQPSKDDLAQDKQPSKDGQIDDVAHHKPLSDKSPDDSQKVYDN
ncbi:DUF4347 domain-containing protein [Pantanalinema rosaneae CENA516]|uniref:DUF4347 domain-containing protein n=1 Tax=Pantanalinema rosaneae TaxID=1620701 RepID=UPI003D6F4BA5